MTMRMDAGELEDRIRRVRASIKTWRFVGMAERARLAEEQALLLEELKDNREALGAILPLAQRSLAIFEDLARKQRAAGVDPLPTHRLVVALKNWLGEYAP